MEDYMMYSTIKPKAAVLSNCLFFTAIVINSLIYVLYNFISSDVEPSIRIYGKTQLVIALFAIGIMLIAEKVKNKIFRQLSFYVLYLIMGALLFIQIVPALLWIMFNGRVVAETTLDAGVMGSWLYGAYHIFIIVWGIFNIRQYRHKFHMSNKTCKT